MDLSAGNALPDIVVHVKDNEILDLSLFERGNGTVTFPTHISLGHELGHVWNILRPGGNSAWLVQLPGVATPNVSISGINAMYWGNILRNRANLPLRLYFTTPKTLLLLH